MNFLRKLFTRNDNSAIVDRLADELILSNRLLSCQRDEIELLREQLKMIRYARDTVHTHNFDVFVREEVTATIDDVLKIDVPTYGELVNQYLNKTS